MSISNYSAYQGLGSASTNADAAVITDLTIAFGDRGDVVGRCALGLPKWSCIEKDLYLHTTEQPAWLMVARIQKRELVEGDVVVTDVKVGEPQSCCHDHDGNDICGRDHTSSRWESRPGGIMVARRRYLDVPHHSEVVTAIDVLFGVDAADPRPRWVLLQQPLQLPDVQPDVPSPRLTVRYFSPATGPDEPQHPRIPLQVKEDGTFKIVQISDTHMVAGVGVCSDAIDAHGQPLPASAADPLTLRFLSAVLDLEKPDLVVLTGDQLHHDIYDSQSALFKLVAPLIKRQIPYAAVFGNHDDEGENALSREAQMSLLQDLPFSLCQPGPGDVDGVGNYHLSILARTNNTQSRNAVPLATLFFVDTHGQIPSEAKDPDYDCIKQTQIAWFIRTSQSLRKGREAESEHGLCSHDRSHLTLAFMHIPLPEYADDSLVITGGHRREPTEGPSFNSHFYHALAKEGVAAVGCGHDHVNDYCGLLHRRDRDADGNLSRAVPLGPWLCYGGGSGFGGYGSYGGHRCHRRSRVWEINTKTGGLTTWKRIEYSRERIDEMMLVEAGSVVTPPASADVRC